MLHRFLARPKVVLTVFVLCLIPLLSYFLIYEVALETDVRRGFAHRNGPAAAEFERFANHFALSYDGLELWVVLIEAKNASNGEHMRMNQRLLNEIDRFDQHIRSFNITLPSGEVINSGDSFGGEVNHLFKWYSKIYAFSNISDAVDLSYPVAKVYQHRLFLGSHFFGINEGLNITDRGIHTVRTAALWYISDAPGSKLRKRLESVELEIFKLALNDSFSDIVSFEMFGDQVANAEMLRGTQETRYLFIIGVFFMMAFMGATFHNLTRKSTVLMIIGAMASPALATACTFALLGWVGARLNSIMCITPFLVMAIGVDDGFLLLHAWRRYHKKFDALPTPVARLEATIDAVITDVAPSMAITSITNTMAFGVGIFSPTVQMSDFCLCTAIAIMLDFFFEFLVFTPFMALFYEQRNEGSAEEKSEKPMTHHNRKLLSWHKYARTLLSPIAIIVVAVLLATLYASSAVGFYNLRISFDPSQAFPSDSKLVKSLQSFEEIQKEYAPLNLITRRVPRIDDEDDVNSYISLVRSLDSRPHCYPDQTHHPLLDYVLWERNASVSRNATPSYAGLPAYLEQRMLTHLRIVDFEGAGDNVSVDGVNWFVVCKGEMNWNLRARAVDTVRKTLSEYSTFDTSLFDYDATIYDIVISVREEVIKAVSITFICMAIACGIFIPSFIGATVATFSMLSITFTMLGSLSHWGATLDPVTMINILLAIGFSVDFSAHICYHFCKARKGGCVNGRAEAMGDILESVGKPIFEASLSTLVCVLPLFALKIYIFNSFAKTVCLVALLGLFHGIVVIPVLLSFFLPRGGTPTSSRAPSIDEENRMDEKSAPIDDTPPQTSLPESRPLLDSATITASKHSQ